MTTITFHSHGWPGCSISEESTCCTVAPLDTDKCSRWKKSTKLNKKEDLLWLVVPPIPSPRTAPLSRDWRFTRNQRLFNERWDEGALGIWTKHSGRRSNVICRPCPTKRVRYIIQHIELIALVDSFWNFIKCQNKKYSATGLVPIVMSCWLGNSSRMSAWSLRLAGRFKCGKH